MIVLAVTVALLALGIPLIAQLRTLDADRAAGRTTVATRIGATATRVLYSILVVIAFAVLPVAWAVGAIPTGGLAPFLTAPLAMRLGDVVSHRRGEELRDAMREGVLLVLGFATLFGAGLVLLP
ncbi:MAG: UbiA family prenyltransferase, partial [Chloroflexi bacterium]|nr:UbiA family prenyltransferase [Chloroflexota bacterium]